MIRFCLFSIIDDFLIVIRYDIYAGGGKHLPLIIKKMKMVVFLFLILLLCNNTYACGEDMLDTCFELSSCLNSILTEQEKQNIVVDSDRKSEFLDYRFINYSYLGINGISFSLVIDHGEMVLQDDQQFSDLLFYSQTTAVSVDEAESIAREYYTQFLLQAEEYSSYQKYAQHFGLKHITSDDCYFIRGFSAHEQDFMWDFQVFPILANNELETKVSYAHETPFPFLQWALISINAQTGEVCHFEPDEIEMEDCFHQWAGLYDEELIASVQKILDTEITDFSMYTFKDSAFTNELQILTEAENMINNGVPIELLCSGYSHEEIVFRILARKFMIWLKAFNRPPVPNILMELSWYPEVIDYAHIHNPQILEMIIRTYKELR